MKDEAGNLLGVRLSAAVTYEPATAPAELRTTHPVPGEIYHRMYVYTLDKLTTFLKLLHEHDRTPLPERGPLPPEVAEQLKPA
ncbi:MAG: hypothetical protein ACK42E_05225, partial [Candidatus Bipolaricaulaceae bacterium]